MAGGSGERFWPVSRPNRPKQLLRLSSTDMTMLEEAIERAGLVVPQENVIVATAPHLVAPIRVFPTGLPDENIVAEPSKRNTAGALVWAAATLMARDEEAEESASMAIVTADHRIAPAEGFAATVSACLDTAEQTGGLVTVGIRPDRPETGFGYIELGEIETEGQVRVSQVRRFREKPDRETAEQFLEAGNFLWNSGMFFWTISAFLREFDQADRRFSDATRAIAAALRNGDQTEATRLFNDLESISIDYALMEKAKSVYCAEAAFSWDDLGSWDALSRARTSDEGGNVEEGPAILIDSEGCVVYNDTTDTTICLLGVHDLVVVASEGAILVCPKDRAQEVKKLVEEARNRGLPIV